MVPDESDAVLIYIALSGTIEPIWAPETFVDSIYQCVKVV